MSWTAHSKRRRWTGLLVLLVVLWMAIPTAVAEEGSETEEQLDEFEHQLESLEDDARELAPDEFEQASQWLRDAQALYAQGIERGLEQRMRRVDYSIDLIRARVDTIEIRQAIEDQQNAYQTSKEQIDELKDEIEDLEAQKENRKQELERIRDEN